MRDDIIYHLALEAEWDAARGGAYTGAADDRRDGFIHFSTAAQVAASAARHRAGRADVVLVTVDAKALGAALRWEESRGGALFPHLYGPLPPRAVIEAAPLPLGGDGHHAFAPHIPPATDR